MSIENLIKNRISEDEGYITFNDFMTISLYDEIYGYYTKSHPPVGKDGDFITSPHTGPLFGALITVQLNEFNNILNNPFFDIVEMGAGAGYLAYDILNYLKGNFNEFYKRIRFHIVEPFANSLKIQQERLSSFQNKIFFYSTIKELPSITGCFISNELLDAFPVHLIHKKNGSFKEVALTLKSDEIVEILIDIQSDSFLSKYINKYIPSTLPDGYVTEVNLDIKNWFENINEKIVKGYIFTIDYGFTSKEYYNPSRNKGTLLCYKDHRLNENYLKVPGEQDITAHINFSYLSHIGKNFNYITEGYTDQVSFLGSLDFQQTYNSLFGEINPLSPEYMAVKRLIIPQGMGTSHKIMIQSKNINSELSLKGFTLRNMDYKL